jgi:hypothetical protein
MASPGRKAVQLYRPRLAVTPVSLVGQRYQGQNNVDSMASMAPPAQYHARQRECDSARVGGVPQKLCRDHGGEL